MLPYLYSIFAYLSNIIKRFFLLNIPFSAIHCIFTVCLPLSVLCLCILVPCVSLCSHTHTIFTISFRCSLSLSSILLILYFSANTMLYLHSHLVYAKLFVSHFIQIGFLLYFLCAIGRHNSSITKEDIFSMHN